MQFLLTVFCLVFVASCSAQTQLPREMPDDVSISLNQTGGMMRAHRKIKVTAGSIEFDELKGDGSAQTKWTKEISRDDAKKLYAVFVENKFDTIRNDVRTETVHDAGSQYIQLSLGVGETFNAVYGKNSPMSGSSLKHYNAVAKAINELLAKYNSDAAIELDEDYLQGKWRAAGESPGRHAWFIDWTFDDGKFKQTGYPAILQEGKYRVVSEEDGKLVLELYDQKGTFGEKTRQMEISVEPETKRMTIDRMKGFTRSN